MKVQRGEHLHSEGRKVVNVVSKLLTDKENSVICVYGHCHNTMTYANICNEEYERFHRVNENIKKGLYRQEEML